MDPDELYTLRTCYYLGHYTLALEEGRNLSRRPMAKHLQRERDDFISRSQIMLKKPLNSNANQLLQVLNNVMNFYDANNKDDVVAQVEALLASDSGGGDESSTWNKLYASQIFMWLGMTREALKCVHLGVTMEHLAMCLQIYIKLDRLDLADQQWQMMKQGDEDATLTQLCGAILMTVSGKSRAEEAVYAYQTLSEQYGPSLMLLNGMIAANMACGNFEAAEGQIEEAMDVADGDNTADVLVNAVAVYQNLGKKDKVQSTVQALKLQQKDHPYVLALNTVEQAFQRVCAQYA